MPGYRGRSAGGGGYPARKSREWVYQEARVSVAGTVVADAAETVTTVSLEHPGTNEDFSAGSLEGLRLTVIGETGNTTLLTPPSVVVLLLHQGESVPTVNTAAAIRQVQEKVWLVGKAALSTGNAMSAGTTRPSWVYSAAPKTSRRYVKGDLLAVVVVNRDAGTWSNPHSYTWAIEGYCAED